MSAINLLRRHGKSIDGFSTTVTEDNFELVDDSFIRFAEESGFSAVRVDLDVIHLLSIPVKTAIQKLVSIKRLASSSGISLTGFWERPVENLNSSILDKHIAFCGGVAGKSMCVSPSEEVFICGYSANNFAELSSEAIKSSEIYYSLVANRLAGRIKRCEGCMIEGQCIGGCHITEEFDALQKEAAIKYNCELYRGMTVELLKDSLGEALRRQVFPRRKGGADENGHHQGIAEAYR
jgi:radical SAM protein with 4Fe4S-binding SPASM domain